MGIKQKINIWLNGFSIKRKNKKILMQEKNGSIYLKFLIVDGKPDDPSCSHRVIRGKVRETNLCISKEAMDLMMYTYLQYKKNLNDNPQHA